MDPPFAMGSFGLAELGFPLVGLESSDLFEQQQLQQQSQPSFGSSSVSQGSSSTSSRLPFTYAATSCSSTIPPTPAPHPHQHIQPAPPSSTPDRPIALSNQPVQQQHVRFITANDPEYLAAHTRLEQDENNLTQLRNIHISLLRKLHREEVRLRHQIKSKIQEEADNIWKEGESDLAMNPSSSHILPSSQSSKELKMWKSDWDSMWDRWNSYNIADSGHPDDVDPRPKRFGERRTKRKRKRGRVEGDEEDEGGEEGVGGGAGGSHTRPRKLRRNYNYMGPFSVFAEMEPHLQGLDRAPESLRPPPPPKRRMLTIRDNAQNHLGLLNDMDQGDDEDEDETDEEEEHEIEDDHVDDGERNKSINTASNKGEAKETAVHFAPSELEARAKLGTFTRITTNITINTINANASAQPATHKMKRASSKASKEPAASSSPTSTSTSSSNIHSMASTPFSSQPSTPILSQSLRNQLLKTNTTSALNTSATSSSTTLSSSSVSSPTLTSSNLHYTDFLSWEAQWAAFEKSNDRNEGASDIADEDDDDDDDEEEEEEEGDKDNRHNIYQSLYAYPQPPYLGVDNGGGCSSTWFLPHHDFEPTNFEDFDLEPGAEPIHDEMQSSEISSEAIHDGKSTIKVKGKGSELKRIHDPTTRLANMVVELATTPRSTPLQTPSGTPTISGSRSLLSSPKIAVGKVSLPGTGTSSSSSSTTPDKT
jgi:hypothetical protein